MANFSVNENPKVASERPGHASISLTLDAYNPEIRHGKNGEDGVGEDDS